VFARATLLATGGAGQVFSETTNPPVATGDGLGMGLRAGAACLDLEFVQFHPTALAVEGAPRFLVSEAVRGEGALLRNATGERFTEELAPRDQVARAIFREGQAGRGPVSLDLRQLEASRVRTRFPRIHATCLRFGIDITKDLVPVTPAAHYVMGGVATDLEARTTLPGLYAAGEVAATGVHGANRLASNSLLEGLVFGARGALAMAADQNPVPKEASALASAPAATAPRSARDDLRQRAWAGLGVERDATGLRGLLDHVASLELAAQAAPPDRASAEDRNLVMVTQAMARCALAREESRGAHCRRDHPDRRDDRFLAHTRLDPQGLSFVDVDLPLPAEARC
jgi:L-aspartate oxidase